MEEWSKDTVMDNTSLDKESLKIPNLHSKWLDYFKQRKTKIKKHTY